MMVTFVSQCEKNALKKTRRVLDAFANRIGDNTWQMLITKDGLDTVQKMLRQTASRSTEVSCHWIRSRSSSQFLWVVGNKRKFNLEGYVAVNSTEKNLLNNEYENDWKYLPVIKALTSMAALLHVPIPHQRNNCYNLKVRLAQNLTVPIPHQRNNCYNI